MNEEVQAQVVDETPATPQEQEAAALEQAVESGEVSSEYGLQDDGVYKVNLDQEPKNTQENAEITDDEQGQDVQEEKEPQAEEEGETANDGPLQQINDQEETVSSEQESEEPQLEEQKTEEQPRVLPEDVDKLVSFMEETGGTVEDFVNLNRDVTKMDPVQTLKEYYKEAKPYLTDEQINRQMNKKFLFSEDDEPDVVEDKKIAFQEELFKAQKHINDRKEKYYADLKLRKDIPQEYQEAYEYSKQQKQEAEKQEKLVNDFQKKTERVFGNEFKGFDFSVGEKKYRYKVSDPAKVKDFQSDIGNFVNGFLGEDGTIADPAGYHRALFAAQNADKLAQHFYEQGKSDAIRDTAAKAKNISMDPRKDNDSVVTSSGSKVRVVSGESGSKLRMKNFRNL